MPDIPDAAFREMILAKLERINDKRTREEYFEDITNEFRLETIRDIIVQHVGGHNQMADFSDLEKEEFYRRYRLYVSLLKF